MVIFTNKIQPYHYLRGAVEGYFQVKKSWNKQERHFHKADFKASNEIKIRCTTNNYH